MPAGDLERQGADGGGAERVGGDAGYIHFHRFASSMGGVQGA
jgi:hypothetical protein